MENQPQHPIPAPPASQLSELICVRCAYSLAGLANDGVCPECGASIHHTIRGNRLDYANPQYLAQLAKGAGLLTFSATCVVGMVLFGLLAMILGLLASAIWGQELVEFVWSALGFVGLGLFLITITTWFIGSLRLLSPEENSAASARVERARSAARSSAKGAFVSLLLIVIAQFIYGRIGGDATYFFAAILVPNLLFFLHFQRICVFASWLAGRIPDEKLVKTLRKARVVSFVVALWAMSPLASTLADNMPSGFLPTLNQVSFVGSFVGLIWSFTILFFFFSPLLWIGYSHTAASRLKRALDRAHLHALAETETNGNAGSQ